MLPPRFLRHSTKAATSGDAESDFQARHISMDRLWFTAT
jgi:hypothetical protein